jgi:ABC-type iron transport system FetAB ATPase subunit
VTVELHQITNRPEILDKSTIRLDSLSHPEGDNGQQQLNSSFGGYSQAFWRFLKIARVLASLPLVTLLVETMARLNPSEIVKMLQVINRAREERNVAILWVEHKVDEHPQDNIFITEEIRIEELAIDGIWGSIKNSDFGMRKRTTPFYISFFRVASG